MGSPRPNVVVVFTDQHRWDTAGVHGNPLELMPNFDRIAKEGTHFAQTFTCQPVCAPARSSFQTGMFATNTGVFKNGIPLREDDVTLAKLFRKAGYSTAYVGKWHLGGVHPGVLDAQPPVPSERRGGYEYWIGADLPEFTSDAYSTTLFDNEGNPVELAGYRVDAFTDAAIRFIVEHKSDPFMLFLSLVEPHFQNSTDDYPAPTGYAARYTGRWSPPDLTALAGSAPGHLGGYYGMVKRIDEAFGRLLDVLISLRLEDDTIVLFTSDHGCHFRTRNLHMDHGSYDDYKRSCHESSIRVPAAAVGPGFGRGGHIQGLVSLIDFPPTLLEAAGIDPPAHMQGHSLMPMVRGQVDSVQDDVYIQISESQIGRAVRTDRWKYSVRAMGRNGHDSAIAHTYTEEFLYDLMSDPYELHNLITHETHSAVAERMRRRLLRRMEAAGEPRAEIIAASRTTQPGHRVVREHEISQ